MTSSPLALLQSLAVNGIYPAVRNAAGSQMSGSTLCVCSPIDGKGFAEVALANAAQAETAIGSAHQCFERWREVPAPRRGEFVRVLGHLFREHKQDLANLITLEMGKTRRESLGEVQEVIDICDFAVGLSRQLYGLTIATERPFHRMMEQWHPLGVVGVITAFNFPMAVWAWNAALAFVCGNSVIWKPSEKTPLCALACEIMVEEAQRRCELQKDFSALSTVVIGSADIGKTLAENARIALVSATGSCRMGKQVASTVAKRLGRSLLELGGNNALIVAPSADVGLALKAVAFSAVGTSGQRCTSLRRLLLHSSIAEDFIARLTAVYRSIKVGDPRNDAVLCGPLIDENAVIAMQQALTEADQQGGKRLAGGEVLTVGVPTGGFYVNPALLRIDLTAPIVQRETFAPILYVGTYDTFDEAILLHNRVSQGLSSALFSNDMREVERWLACGGSDCGIANVNIGTSGAEIGGAFGGDKETGGGRESGSDAWKNYMRRVTNTINYGSDIPLAQGIDFPV